MRNAMQPEAPWSDKAKKAKPLLERQTAVVYVVGAEEDEWNKMGCTTQLKSRVSQLSTQRGKKLQVKFWAEYPRETAKRVEGLAKKDLRGVERMGEWFNAHEEKLARSIVDQHERPIAMGGFPGSEGENLSEVQEHLAEPVLIHGRSGRLPREEWSPQKNSIRT